MAAGWLRWAELRLALSAPRPRDGFTSDWVTVRGLRTHYRSAGGATRTPVVLLHGLAVSHRYLMPTAHTLSRRHPVYVPDLPGFGLSAKVSTDYGVADRAGHVAALLDRLNLPPACVVGHSFGAEVAAALAARHPDAVRGLVLIGPTSDPVARSRRGQVGRLLADLPREDPRQAAILLRDVRDAGIRRVLATLRASVQNAIERDLAATGVPTLLLRGARDPVAPTRWLTEAARVCGGPTRTGSVRRAGHNVATTAGAEVAAQVEQFVAQRCATADGRQRRLRATS